MLSPCQYALLAVAAAVATAFVTAVEAAVAVAVIDAADVAKMNYS